MSFSDTAKTIKLSYVGQTDTDEVLDGVFPMPQNDVNAYQRKDKNLEEKSH